MPEHTTKNHTEKVYEKMLRKKGLERKKEYWDIKIKKEKEEDEGSEEVQSARHRRSRPSIRPNVS